MIKRIISIHNPANLSVKDKQLVITQWEDKNTIPLEDIGIIVLDNREINTRASIFDACDEFGIAILHTNISHMPATLSVPIFGHTFANNFLYRQLEATLPVKKQLWTMIISEKIQGQIQVLKKFSKNVEWLENLAKNIRSGDPDNIEAQVANKYWKILFWENFVRERNSLGVNACLNYGYGVLRAALARAVVAGGLHPSLGMWHSNQYNYFNLVDDLIEPFRPLVDNIVFKIFLKNFSQNENFELTSELKRELLSVLSIDIEYRGRSENMTSLLEWYVATFREWLLESKKFIIPSVVKYLQKN